MGGGESVSPLSFVYLLPQLFPPTTHYCWDLIFLSGYFFVLLLQSFSWPLRNPDRIYPNFLKKPKLNCVWKRRGLFLPLLQINMTYDMGSPGWMMEFSPFVLPTKPIIRLIQMFALGLWIIFTFDPRLLTYIPIVAVNRTRGCVGDCDIDCDDTIMRVIPIHWSTALWINGYMGIWVHAHVVLWLCLFFGGPAGRLGGKEARVICKA